MAQTTHTPDPLTALLTLPMEVGQTIMAQVAHAFAPDKAAPNHTGPNHTGPNTSDTAMPDASLAAQWADMATRMQSMWLDYQSDATAKILAGEAGAANALGALPPAMVQLMESWARQIPLVQPETQERLVADGIALWENVLEQWGIGSKDTPAKTGQPATAPHHALPYSDRRFADAAWRETPFFTLVHQTYLILAKQITAMSEAVEGLDPARKEQLRFMTRTLVDALSPDHFPMTNPLVIEKAMETQGQSLIKGMEHLLADLKAGKLSHTDTSRFELGKNIACTPGKVVLRTPMFELLHYTPTTEKVDAVPLLIFPPWINRFYILDLNPKKSFVQWALDQGISVFMVSWKSADKSMADVEWDDYIAAQIEAIDAVRTRLKVPAVHTIGYCVAGSTLAATLAILAQRGEADKVASATFFTAQVDFEKAGDLKNFIDDQQLAVLGALAQDGVVDGRYLAAAFNLLRPNDLIWGYVLRNYLLGEDYPAFDLLYWNGDSTNLPAKWHQSYLRNLYRDNLLVKPDAMEACGTPIDLTRITTPCYIQAGREDHIAPPESVWRFTRHLQHAPYTFLLAGSGHIAGVVNPPAANKYQYWTVPEGSKPTSLAEFMASAQETAGSWWPHWLGWLRSIAPEQVPAKGKRVPGGPDGKARSNKVLGDAPGDYVRMR